MPESFQKLCNSDDDDDDDDDDTVFLGYFCPGYHYFNVRTTCQTCSSP